MKGTPASPGASSNSGTHVVVSNVSLFVEEMNWPLEEAKEMGAVANTFRGMECLHAEVTTGDQLDFGNTVCGAVFSIRFGEDNLSVWNQNAADNQETCHRANITENPRVHMTSRAGTLQQVAESKNGRQRVQEVQDREVLSSNHVWSPRRAEGVKFSSVDAEDWNLGGRLEIGPPIPELQQQHI